MSKNIYERAKSRSTDESAPKVDEIKTTPDRLLGAIDRIFATEDGKLVLWFIADLSEYFEPTLCLDRNSGEINTLATAATAAKQSVYQQLRAYIRHDILKDVEFFKPQSNTQEG